MYVKDSDLKPNVPVDMNVTRQRFAVLTTARDLRWRNVPSNVNQIDSADARRLRLAARDDAKAKQLRA